MLHIACSADANYLPHAATLIQSLAASNPPDRLSVNLVHDGSVSTKQRDALMANCEQLGITLACLQPSPTEISELPPAGRFSKLIWSRLLLPELLPDVDRVLYVDADTVVLHALDPLFTTPLEGQPLAAARAPTTVEGIRNLANLGLSPDFAYFNSGVLLMDLAEMRSENLSERIFRCARDRGASFRFPDQDALNLVCEERWQALHPRWNALASFFLGDSPQGSSNDLEYLEARTSPAILHFEGSALAKPWHARCLHPHREVYRQYRDRTPWPIECLEGESFTASMLRGLPIGMQLAIGNIRRFRHRAV